MAEEESAHVPCTSTLITAVLIFALCGDASLAEYYISSVARRFSHSNQAVHVPRLDLEFMQTLLGNHRIGRSVARAFHTLSNKYRLQADKFLMNSLLADYVIQQNLKGVVITADTAICLLYPSPCLRDSTRSSMPLFARKKNFLTIRMFFQFSFHSLLSRLSHFFYFSS